jgi:hypothetical protein
MNSGEPWLLKPWVVIYFKGGQQIHKNCLKYSYTDAQFQQVGKM